MEFGAPIIFLRKVSILSKRLTKVTRFGSHPYPERGRMTEASLAFKAKGFHHPGSAYLRIDIEIGPRKKGLILESWLKNKMRRMF
jgi:hypothetical protein